MKAAPRVLEIDRTPAGDRITMSRLPDGRGRLHFDLINGSPLHRAAVKASKKAGLTLDQWMRTRLKAWADEEAVQTPLKVSAKSTTAFVAAAKVLGVTPAEVADYLIGSVCRDLDDPTHGLLSDMAAGGHIPLPRKELPAIRERFLKWAEARKMPRKRAVRQLAAAAA